MTNKSTLSAYRNLCTTRLYAYLNVLTMQGRETNLCICVVRTNKSRVFLFGKRLAVGTASKRESNVVETHYG